MNEYSNTVFFRRPSPRVVSKYTLAQGYDNRFGGELAHVVVMQHVSSEIINMFIDDLVEEQPTGVSNAAASSQRSGETRKVVDGTQVVIKKDNDVYDLSGKRVKKNTFDLRKQSKYLNDNEDVPILAHPH